MIARLDGKNRTEQWVACEVIEEPVERKEAVAKHRPHANRQHHCLARGLWRCRPSQLIRHGRDDAHVPVDSLRLGWKPAFQSLSEPSLALGNVKARVADDGAIIAIRIQLQKNEIVRNPESLVDPSQARSRA